VLPLLLALAFQCPDGTPPPCRLARGTTAPITVAVLPFDNLSRDTSDAYLAQGLTEEITSRLAQVERLTVTSAAVMRHYGRSEDPRRVASSIRVMHVIAGTVRHERQRLRVSVELIRGRDGVVAWNRAYDQPDSMLLDIQDEIARSVTTSIAGRLLPGEAALLQTRRRNPQAYDHYLRGVYDITQRTRASLRRALQELELALRIDSSYGDAIAQLSYANYLLGASYYDTSLGVSRDSLVRQARRLALLALERDTLSSKAWGIASTVQADPARKRAMLDRALAIDPRNVEALVGLAMLQANGGDFVSGQQTLRRAVAADPTRWITILSLGMQLAYERNPAEALGWLDSAITFHPEAPYAYSDRAHIRLQLGDTAGARMDAGETARLGNDTAAAVILALIDLRDGRAARARATADSLARHLPGDCRLNYNCLEVAALFGALGDVERVMGIMGTASGYGAESYQWIQLAEFDPVRQTDQFRQLQDALRPSRTPR
jgi:TolB-like protein